MTFALLARLEIEMQTITHSFSKDLIGTDSGHDAPLNKLLVDRTGVGKTLERYDKPSEVTGK